MKKINQKSIELFGKSLFALAMTAPVIASASYGSDMEAHADEILLSEDALLEQLDQQVSSTPREELNSCPFMSTW